VSDIRGIDDVNFQALVDAAKAEGQVVWYTSVNTRAAEDIAAQFTDEYGIPVVVVRSGGAAILQRFLLEADSGSVQNDVVSASDPDAFTALKAAGYFDCFTPRRFDELAAWAQDPEGCYSAHRGNVQIMSYRTDLVSEAPTSIEELADPKYRGMVVHGNPNFGGQMLVVTATLIKTLGIEWYERFAANNPLIVQGNAQVLDTVETGERSIGAFSSIGRINEAMKEGAPLQFVYPSEGAIFVSGPNAIAKGAPNPAAARLFMDFLLTDGPQKRTVDGGQYAGIASFDPPEGLEPIANLNLLTPDLEWLQAEGLALIERWTEIMGAERN